MAKWLLIFLFMLGLLSPLRHSANAQDEERWMNSRHETAGGIPYYIIEPLTVPQDAALPVLLALHGAGGDGMGMVRRFAPVTEQRGILLIAPSFGMATPYDRQVEALSDILDNVRAHYEIDERGIVLYGISAGATFATYFAKVTSETVLGFVAEVPPNLYALNPDNDTTIYWLVYGEFDTGLELAYHFIPESLLSGAYPVRLDVVPNLGHAASPRAFEITFQLIEEVYGQ